MFFLYFVVLSLNFHTGSLVFYSFFRTQSNLFYKINLLTLTLLHLLGFQFGFGLFLRLTILCTPLFIGIFPLLLHLSTASKRRSKNYKTTLSLLECISIHLQMGQSFLNSLGLASRNLPPYSNLHIFLKKNVVLQQPKSRKCTIFNELEQNLNTLSQQNLGKRELLSFIKYKFQLSFELEQKIQLSSTQYKTQSFALIFFWILSFINLVAQGYLSIYKNMVLISVLLMVLGLLLAKKLIVKTEFRI